MLKYLSGTAIFTQFFVPFASVPAIRPALYFYEGAPLSLVSFALLITLSLLKLHKHPEVSE